MLVNQFSLEPRSDRSRTSRPAVGRLAMAFFELVTVSTVKNKLNG